MVPLILGGWWRRFDAWANPPPASGAERQPGEVQRLRIGRFLTRILLITFGANVLLALSLPGDHVTNSCLTALSIVGLFGVCLLACHFRRATLAAWIYLTFAVAATVSQVEPPNPHMMTSPLSMLSALLLFLPIATAGILLGVRQSVMVLVTEMALSFGGDWYSGASMSEAVSDLLPLASALLAASVVVGVGIGSLNQALREADRSAELDIKNGELRGAVAQLGQREEEARRQARFLDAVFTGIAPDIFFVVDAREEIVQCNEAFLRLLDIHTPDADHLPFERFTRHIVDYHLIRDTVRADLRATGHATAVLEFVAPNGLQLWMECNATLLPDQRVYLVVGRDITERHELEQQMERFLIETERGRQELQTVFDTTQDVLAVYDLQGRLIQANTAYYRKLYPHGVPTAEIVARVRRDLRLSTLEGAPMAPEDLGIVKLLRTGEPQPVTFLRTRNGDGEGYVFEMRFTALRDERGEMIGGLAVGHDITEEYRHQHSQVIQFAVAEACSGAAEVATVAESALLALGGQLRPAVALVTLRDGANGRVLAHYPHDGPEREIADLHRMIERTPISATALEPLSVIATGEPVFDLAMPMLDGAPGADGGTMRCAAAPLRINGDVIGSLSVRYDVAAPLFEGGIDRDMMMMVANAIASALQRAQLYEDARRLAIIDPLTGLRNHRALHDELRAQLAVERTLPVSLVMLDIDHFRRFNEEAGHQAGDEALRAVARIVRATITAGDIAARFGGEEFAIVLPGATTQRALEVADRIRARLAALAIAPGESGEAARAITISLGIATFPEHASAAASLLKAAELALIAAKRAGRDRVTPYSLDLLRAETRVCDPTMPQPDELHEIVLPSGADLDTVQALITAIDLRDGYTAAHSEGVASYATALGRELGLATELVEALHLGGLVHDVGKIGVPDSILRKPDKLDDAEWVVMRAHTTMGEAILRPVEQLRHLLPLVRWHHERLDGSGYPDGLKGEQIPYLVRILSVADVFDAFTAERPYHPGRSPLEGLLLLRREVDLGRMDGAVVAAFQHLLERQGILQAGPTRGQDLLEVA